MNFFLTYFHTHRCVIPRILRSRRKKEKDYYHLSPMGNIDTDEIPLSYLYQIILLDETSFWKFNKKLKIILRYLPRFAISRFVQYIKRKFQRCGQHGKIRANFSDRDESMFKKKVVNLCAIMRGATKRQRKSRKKARDFFSFF